MSTIKEYVKQFFGQMLDIHDVLEKDKAFYFFKDLKIGVKTKLYE